MTNNPIDNKVLSEQELWDLIRSILNHEGHLDLRTANIISVIKEQKIAWADMVKYEYADEQLKNAEIAIGDYPDDIQNYNRELRGKWEERRRAQNILTEQRQRNNLNATSGGNDE